MTDPDSDLFDAFLLGQRMVCEAHDIRVPGTEAYKFWDLLREVAEGRITLVSSPAETALAQPDLHPELKAYLSRNTGRLIAKDRALAERILGAFTLGVSRAREPE